MGCGCGDLPLRDEVGNSLFKSGYMPRSGPNGVYELASHPGCFQPYTGRQRNQSVYVIGLGTEDEKVFLRKESKDAIRYAKEMDAQLDHLLTDTLCHEAMTEFFGE